MFASKYQDNHTARRVHIILLSVQATFDKDCNSVYDIDILFSLYVKILIKKKLIEQKIANIEGEKNFEEKFRFHKKGMTIKQANDYSLAHFNDLRHMKRKPDNPLLLS